MDQRPNYSEVAVLTRQNYWPTFQNMARRTFWNVVKDDERRSFEVLGLTTDDTPLINETCAMQNLGMRVRSESIESSVRECDIPASYVHINYLPERGLMERLRAEAMRRKNLPGSQRTR